MGMQYIKPQTPPPLTWSDYVTLAEYVSSNGNVITYLFQGQPIYRTIPNPYVYRDDKFFSDNALTIQLANRS